MLLYANMMCLGGHVFTQIFFGRFIISFATEKVPCRGRPYQEFESMNVSLEFIVAKLSGFSLNVQFKR